MTWRPKPIQIECGRVVTLEDAWAVECAGEATRKDIWAFEYAEEATREDIIGPSSGSICYL